ncbi:hypothetical protein EDC39_1193 [Geothermobacter ehrlichii]|uniref:Uncharacterized protein n=1 Tax=Geothermobacter ehrlichii TaxID=213224 RepID=A0A5D3WGY8_9BACT|nr:hypothetical protein [Geothermobacter ehrlichii]TYO95429.1 hypothetical protein EDC39_1193 [Geothermobacter ehrlichii]
MARTQANQICIDKRDRVTNLLGLFTLLALAVYLGTLALQALNGPDIITSLSEPAMFAPSDAIVADLGQPWRH